VGLLAWFLVGVGILLVGLVVLLGIMSTILIPVTLGAILAPRRHLCRGVQHHHRGHRVPIPPEQAPIGAL
jgi:hypothetical protein